jgi:hypothetical protein
MQFAEITASALSFDVDPDNLSETALIVCTVKIFAYWMIMQIELWLDQFIGCGMEISNGVHFGAFP